MNGEASHQPARRLLLSLFLFSAVVLAAVLALPLWGARAAPRASFNQVWNLSDTATSNQTRAKLAFNSHRDEVLVAWEDGRNDPGGLVDTYGFANNTDLFARTYTSGGTPGEELTLAAAGEYSHTGRYDNEQWPAVTYDPWARRTTVGYMTIPDPVLAAGAMQTTTCYDIAQLALSPLARVDDLAWYTAPPTLTFPFGGGVYDWSCQHEPEAIALAADTTLTVWQDSRERYEEVDGDWVMKDVYAQVVAGGERLYPGGVLLTSDAAGRRLRFIQENPDVAGGDGLWLVVWEDERASAETSTTGYRDVYARYLTYDGGVLAPGESLLLAAGLEGSTLMAKPRVSYLQRLGLFVIVWTRLAGYTDPASDSADLMMAVLDRQGAFAVAPRVIAGTTLTASPRTQEDHTHDLACAAQQCLLVYRHGSSTANMAANLLIADDWSFAGAQALDALPGYHSYANVEAGAEGQFSADFYVGYTVEHDIRVARWQSEADYGGAVTATATPSLTPTPTATPSPMPSPTPTATATLTRTLTATPTAASTATPSPSPTATTQASATPSPTSTATLSPTPTPLPDLGHIEGRVYYDRDGNAVFGEGDVGIPGVFILLTEESGAGYLRMSDDNGLFRFHNLSPGFYVLNEEQPVGWSAPVPTDRVEVWVSAGHTHSFTFGHQPLPSATPSATATATPAPTATLAVSGLWLPLYMR